MDSIQKKINFRLLGRLSGLQDQFLLVGCLLTWRHHELLFGFCRWEFFLSSLDYQGLLHSATTFALLPFLHEPFCLWYGASSWLIARAEVYFSVSKFIKAPAIFFLARRNRSLCLIVTERETLIKPSSWFVTNLCVALMQFCQNIAPPSNLIPVQASPG